MGSTTRSTTYTTQPTPSTPTPSTPEALPTLHSPPPARAAWNGQPRPLKWASPPWRPKAQRSPPSPGPAQATHPVPSLKDGPPVLAGLRPELGAVVGRAPVEPARTGAAARAP